MPDDAPVETFSAELIKTVCDNSLPPREEFGQNFLVDWSVPREEVSHADLGEGESVLEIGPGLGSLTCFLADRADEVVAVEKDDRFGPMLAGLAESYGNVEVIYADALDYNLASLRFDKVVANLPFGVSLPLIFDLLDTDFETAVLLIQDDLADRLTRSPGDPGYNRLSVQLSRTADVSQVGTVPRQAFYPPPDVDGALVKIEQVDPKFEVPSEEFFKNTLMFCFAQREKTVRDALLALDASDGPVNLSTTDLVELHEGPDDDLLDRPVEEVTASEFGRLSRFLWEEFGLVADRAIERYYDEHGLYKRARGKK